jgi:hypothetical protein
MWAMRHGVDMALLVGQALPDILDGLDISSDEEERPNRQGQGPRTRLRRVPTVLTAWWILINTRGVEDPTHILGRRFRQRYRVSYARFRELVDDASGWLDPDGNPVFPRPRDDNDLRTTPVAIKVMMALRWLATGAEFDVIGELAQTSETLARVSALTWCREFTSRRAVEWIAPPTGDDLRVQMHIFARCGHPGAVFSADVVHIGWDQCPSGEFSLHKGKEGFCTRAFQVSVTHLKRIVACTKGHPGARNDKTIVRYDQFILDIKEKRLWNGILWKLRKRDGTVYEVLGLYGIVDGGYHQWRCLQAVEKHAADEFSRAYSANGESVRKEWCLVDQVLYFFRGRFGAAPSLPSLPPSLPARRS